MKKNLIPLTLGGLGIGTTEFVMMGLLPDIAKDFNVSIPVAGHLISAYALGVVIGAPLLVAISSNYPPKKILIALMVMFTVFNAFSAFAPDDHALFIARLLSGLPHGAFFGVGSVVASRLAEKGKQAQAISVMFAGLTIANLLSVPLGTYIGHHYSWRYTFGLIAFIGLMALLFIQLWLPALPVSREGDIKSEMGFFKTREAWLILLTTAIGTGGLFCWISYIAPLMTDVGHFSKNSVPLILIVAGLGMVIGNILGGKLADWVAPVKACLILLISMAVALIGIYFVSGNQVLSIIMTFITGALSMAIGSPIQILMIRTAKGAEMLGAAATQAAFNTGNALGAFLGGLPIAMGYGFTSPELVGVVMAITGALFAMMLAKRQSVVKRELELV
ncbi:MFS transporter [Mucilaginibacter dorajii]|uniref:MFS transporter AraJ n=1 Tax=Mucilaginibacter dorajii TaxID=692994 RepID=A0ABP7QVF1_9SPHI|nr:MFS transporter [Mucilaginibacter dorajii]MCS3735744.1 DHA1 family arabinose polymer transporter-like MFS transporter [Mucilaginibacter dorajii]